MEDKTSFDEVRVLLKEIAASQKETDRELKEIAAARKEADKELKELRDAQKETDRGLKELDKEVKETTKSLKEFIAGISDSNGYVAEEVIQRAVARGMMFGGVKFDDIYHGMNRQRRLPDGTRIKGQYDVVLINCAAAALIDVKYRVRKDDIEYLLGTQMPKFRVLFPQYKDFDLYLGLGGMSFEDGAEEAALKKGIGTFRLNGDVMEVNDKNVSVFKR